MLIKSIFSNYRIRVMKRIYSLLCIFLVACCFSVSVNAVSKQDRKNADSNYDNMLQYFYSLTGGRSVKDLSLDFLTKNIQSRPFVANLDTFLTQEIEKLAVKNINAEKKEFLAILQSIAGLIQAKNFGPELIEQQKKCLEFMKKLAGDIVTRYFATFQSYEKRHAYELLFYAAFNMFQLTVTAWQVAQKENQISNDINSKFLEDFDRRDGKSYEALRKIVQRVQSIATLERIKVGIMTKEEVSRQEINIKDFTKEKILMGLRDAFVVIGTTLAAALVVAVLVGTVAVAGSAAGSGSFGGPALTASGLDVLGLAVHSTSQSFGKDDDDNN
jgi:hypothetical protein